MHFELKFLDSAVQKESKFIKILLKDFAKYEEFVNNTKRVSLISSKRKINKSQLDVFLNSNDTGIIYFLFEEEFLDQLKEHYMKLISNTHDRDALLKLIQEIYKNVMDNNNNLSLIFEIAILKSYILFFNENIKNIDNAEKVFANSINVLRDILIQIRNEICSYNIFNREFHKAILDKATIIYTTKFTDKWEVLKGKIHSYFLPFTLFIDLVHFFNTLASLDHEVEIIEYFDNKTIWSIEDITNPPYVYYLPYLRDEIKSIILKTINKKSKQTLEYLTKEEKDLNNQLNQLKNEIANAHSSFNDNFSKEIMKSLVYPIDISLIGKVNSYIIDFNRKVMGNILTANRLFERYNLLKKKILKNEQLRNIKYDDLINIYKKNKYIEDSDIFLSIIAFDDYSKRFEELYNKHHKYIVQTAKKSFSKIKNLIKENKEEAREEMILMDNILVSKGIKKNFNYDLVKENYIQIMKSIENDISIFLLLNNIKIYNFEHAKDTIKKSKEEFFIKNYLLPNNKIYIIAKNKNPQINLNNSNLGQINEAAKIIKSNYSRLVSTLVYDIRGSSFMSAKLRNAEKQKFIIKKFQNLLIPLIKNNNGIPVKETGDGGIAIFAHKSKDLYRNIYKESVSSKNVHIRHSIATGSDITLKEDDLSSKHALVCANNMIKKAEDFIKDNYMNYRDWFYDIQEKKLIHEGIEYALLPPEFKSLFRIGVGISSGVIGKDIEMAINAYGDIDLYGVCVNDAKILSEGKDPTSSVILADHASIFHYILNADFFMNKSDEEKNGFLDEILKIMDKGIINEIYSIEDLKIKLHGYYLLNEMDKTNRIIYENLPDYISIDESGNLLLQDEPVKLLYQIII